MVGNEPKLVPENHLGDVKISLVDIVRNMNMKTKHEIKLKDSSNRGFIYVYSEQSSLNKDYINLDLDFKNLNKSNSYDFFFDLFSSKFSKFSPVLRIGKQIEDGSYITVYTSDIIITNKLKIKIKYQTLCGCDNMRKLKFSILDLQTDGDYVEQYYLFSSYSELNQGQELNFSNNNSTLIINKLNLQTVHNYLDYLNNGVQINLIVSVDFTASNKFPTYPDSLHYINPNPNVLNQYQKCISTVSPILIQWDTDKIIPVYGFGAKYPNSNTTNHCFPMFTGDGVYELQGILQSYTYHLSNNILNFSGPTNFAPTLKMLNLKAKECKDTDYFILLIMTDGQICDMDDTISEIVKSSYLPISIVIVGVGDADFENMDILDSDENKLKCPKTKKVQLRDNVQFVPYLEYMNDFEKLKREVLLELPDQIEQYYSYKKLNPTDIRGKSVINSYGSINIPEYNQDF
eukprot:Mrub_02589.p1 GENE.Mrub_02589~~Mrub_02589.p1  ORF type:complete len:535 (-),score=52.82 Mrub_02589:67-1443(-)